MLHKNLNGYTGTAMYEIQTNTSLIDLISQVKRHFKLLL